VGGVEVDGRSGDVLNEDDPKGGSVCPPVKIPTAAVPALRVEIPMTVASIPDPSVVRRASRLTWI
jgi:hypothetical protein